MHLVATCPSAALVADEELGQLAVYQPITGARLAQVKVLGEVLGCGTSGLVLARGRSVGYLTW